ncbi:MAG TPA: hypothetical protein VGL86_14730 [Polyangia bacterium]|jgi:hypothetical protein
MRCVLLAFALFAAAAAGCDSQSSCLPAIAGSSACAMGTYIDASTTDPVCLSQGSPLCRGPNNATCYTCTGADFEDNCTITAPQETVECVHSCDKC